MNKIFALTMISLFAFQHGYLSGMAEDSASNGYDTVDHEGARILGNIICMMKSGQINDKMLLQFAGTAAEGTTCLEQRKYILEECFSKNVVSQERLNKLLYKAVSGRLHALQFGEDLPLEIVDLLLKKGADPHGKCKKKPYPTTVYEQLQEDNPFTTYLRTFPDESVRDSLCKRRNRLLNALPPAGGQE